MRTNTASAAVRRRLLDEAGPTMPIPDVAKVLGIHRTTAYELARRDELGVPVMQLGQRLVVPTAKLRRALGVDEADDTPGAA